MPCITRVLYFAVGLFLCSFVLTSHLVSLLPLNGFRISSKLI
jgi:uncharacterized membrane protein (DUF485 family)